MFRGCPTTGRMSHKFDKVTHRCVCGRWQAGFKPKCEPVRPRAECQICEREQALDGSGNLGHHGYTRPGCGYTIGGCMGVGHKPYTETDALVLYLKAVQGYIAGCKAQLAELVIATELTYTTTTGHGKTKQTHNLLIKRGDEYGYDGMKGYSTPDFDGLLKRKLAAVDNDIRFATQDETRVIARIKNAVTSLVACEA